MKLSPKNFNLKLIRAQEKYTTFKAKVLRTSILRGVEICMVHPIESSSIKEKETVTTYYSKSQTSITKSKQSTTKDIQK